MLTANPCTRLHTSGNAVDCRALLQESNQALAVGDCQLALRHAERVLREGQQNSCAECLYAAAWHLGRVYVHLADYAHAAAAFARAQQSAGDLGDTAAGQMIALSLQLCLALDEVALTGSWLAGLQAQIGQRLAEVDAHMRAALISAAQHQFSESQRKPCASAASANSVVTCESTNLLQPDFDIQCLGGFAVYRRAHPVTLPRNRKAGAVLKHLVMHRERSVSRDALMDLGWPNAAPKVAANSLNTTISLLRRYLTAALDRVVPGSPILFEDGYYGLNPALVLRVDVIEFGACYDRGLACARAGRPVEAIDAYRSAAALYQGDLVVDDQSDATTIIERERLAHAYLTLLGKLTEYCVAQGHYEEAIHYAHRLLRQDPCHEEAHCQVMRCLAWLGQRAQALHQYDLCESLLRRELDVEPSADTISLRQRIARGQCV